MITTQTVPSFWKSYRDLPDEIRKTAKKAFEIWKENPFHPSLHFKCVESKTHVWSLRVSLGYRALCVFEGSQLFGFGLAITPLTIV